MNEVYLAFKESRGSEDHLEHHGIRGQKWGHRRYQNPDGTLTEEGRKRYNLDGSNKKQKPQKKNRRQDDDDDDRDDRVHKKFTERADTLGDEELDYRISRMDKEIRYNTKQNILYPDRRKARKEAIKKIFLTSAVNAAQNVMDSVYTTIGKRAFRSLGLLDKNDGQQKKPTQNQPTQNQPKQPPQNPPQNPPKQPKPKP